MDLQGLAGAALGSRDLEYDARDAILYALAVGTGTARIDLVYERDLRVLPTYACALGLWAVEAAGGLGAYDRNRSLHASQTLVMHAEMPPRGPVASRGRVAGVWDKGKAAMVDVAVESDLFTATYSIFLPGRGGFGGERGPAAPVGAAGEGEPWVRRFATGPDLATLYRLTGDRHPIHIDPEVAHQNGFDRPILHGLCTLGIAAREAAEATGAHPADLREIRARLAAPVMPGDAIAVAGRGGPGGAEFEARVGETAVLKGGWVRFET